MRSRGRPPKATVRRYPNRLRERRQALRLAQAEDGFAAEIVDDSADLVFAVGTVLFLRSAPLQIGAKIVVRFFIADANTDGRRQTYEILYGILDQNVLGDLVLVTRTRN